MSKADTPAPKPTVLSFNYHDASGGAGVAADIEAIASQDCHACTVVTCLSVQDSQLVSSLIPIDEDIIVQSARAVLEDNPIATIKVGLIGSVEGAQAIHEILLDYTVQHAYRVHFLRFCYLFVSMLIFPKPKVTKSSVSEGM